MRTKQPILYTMRLPMRMLPRRMLLQWPMRLQGLYLQMKLLILALLALTFLSGCEPDRVPSARRHVVARGSIVVVKTDSCVWCDKQKALLDKMKRDGDLQGVTVKVDYTSPRYPATSFPTLYIQNRSGTIRAVGYQDRAAILRAF